MFIVRSSVLHKDISIQVEHISSLLPLLITHESSLFLLTFLLQISCHSCTWERQHDNCHCDTSLLCTYDHLQLHPLSCKRQLGSSVWLRKLPYPCLCWWTLSCCELGWLLMCRCLCDMLTSRPLSKCQEWCSWLICRSMFCSLSPPYFVVAGRITTSTRDVWALPSVYSLSSCCFRSNTVAAP